MPGIGVVFNPKSRRNLRDPGAADRLAQIVAGNGLIREARSIDELARIAREFRDQAIDILAISGGDGTNTVTLTGFIHTYGDTPLPPVALLRGGTMNTVASSVGVAPGTPEGVLAKLVEQYVRRQAAPLSLTSRNLLRVSRAGEQVPQYGFLFGAGVVHGFLAEYYRGGDPTPLVAAQTLARGIASALIGGEMIRRMAKPFRGSVTLDDGTRWEERDYLAIAAGTVAHIGLGFKPFYRYGERRDAFHVLGIYASPAQFAGELVRIQRGEPMRRGRAYEALTRTMRVESTDGPLKFMVDGDLHQAEASPGASEGLPGSSANAVVDVSLGPLVRLVIDVARTS